MLTEEQIARVAHEANRAYCATLGDWSQPQWEMAPQWQRESALTGVRAVQIGAVREPWDSHNSWLAQKQADGWVYGPVKDAEAKTHPCMVPYTQLAPEQQMKDHLFLAVVKALSGLV